MKYSEVMGVRIDFRTDEAYPYAAARFCEMSGMADDESEAAASYARIREDVQIRASVRVFDDAAADGAVNLGSAVIECPPLRSIRGTVCAYVLTAGEFRFTGGTLSDTLADMWGTAFTDAGLVLLHEKIAAKNPGKHVSHPFGPGFYGINTSEVGTIFAALDCEDAGITLNNGLLFPIKSSIGFFLVTDDETALPARDCMNCTGDTSCEYCKNHTIKITFVNENKTAAVSPGTTAAQAARTAGIAVDTPCGGMGICGKCTGIVTVNGDTKIAKLCTERLYGNAYVYTKNGDTKNGDTKIDVLDRVHCGRYSLAVDIGTTTIEAELIGDTKIVARANMRNPQAYYAADVIGRIAIASKNGAMTALIIDALNDMISQITRAAGIERDKITACIFSGNTVMQTIIAGENPQSLGQYPYRIPDTFGREIDASQLGINLSCGIYFPPVISAFVGGDITCGIAYTRLWERDRTLLLDVGTNGEIAYVNGRRLTVASAAAGPAFEGMGVTFGMRAEAGAISRFKIASRNTVMVETIDKAPAAGICGSGLLEIIAELVKNGIITSDGAFADKRLITSPIRGRLCEYNGEAAFKVCGGVYITQSDVRAVQLAKGAIRAAVEMAAPDAERVIIAGALGQNTGENNLIDIGILPEKFYGHVEFAENTSLRGAVQLLQNADLRGKTQKIISSAETVSLSENEDFERLFVKYMNFVND